MGTGPSRPAQPYPAFAHEGSKAAIRRVALIANPKSGGNKGIAVAAALRAELEKHGITVETHMTTHGGHAMELAAALDFSGVDAICALGGDGTAHETINGLVYGSLWRAGFRGAATAGAATAPAALKPVCLVPCGSGNTLAFNLGIWTMEDSLKALLSGRVQPVDVLELTDPDRAAPPRLASAGDASAAATTAVSGDAVAAADSAVAATDASSAAGAAVAAPAAPTAAGAASLAVIAAPAPPTAADLAALREHVVFSVNMVGWALSSAVLDTANNLRWLGSAQYNIAAYSQLIANNVWPASIEWVAPREPITVSAEALAAARARRSPASAPGGGGGGASGGAGASCCGTAATGTAAATADGAGASSADTLPLSADADKPLATSAASAAASQLLPVLAPPSVVSNYVMFQAQTTAYMGEKMAFCPLAVMDDGLMDICTIMKATRLELVATVDDAKAYGQHVLGRPTGAAGPRDRNIVRYAQAAEIILRPLVQTEMDALHAGGEVVEPGAGASRVAPGDAAGRAARAARVKADNVATRAMSGPRSVNVDGELTGFTPMRIKVLPRVLPMLCPPGAK